MRVVEVGENDTDPATWGKNWPAEYDSYKRTAITTRTRFDAIQQRNYDLVQRGGQALVGLLDAIGDAKTPGASLDQLATARQLQRHAQWRLDFIAAENSMGFHAPQEAARVLGEAIDYARQGQIAAMTATATATAPAHGRGGSARAATIGASNERGRSCMRYETGKDSMSDPQLGR